MADAASQLDDYRWLVNDAAPWLRQVAEDRRPLVAQASRLRKQLSSRRVHLVLQQVELRRKARAKFARADRMFFTPIGLEQATDEWVARYKASRFPPGAPLADLCCGIGGDLGALAERGPTVGIDRDWVTALLAEANLRALEPTGGFPSAGHPLSVVRGCSLLPDAPPNARPACEVRVGDVADASVSEFPAWHLDPDRRAHGRRTTSVGRCHPGLPIIQRLLRERAHAAVKLAPATDPPEAWTQEAEFEWISRRRQSRQLVAWFGGLAEHAGRRRATILGVGPSGQPAVLRTVIGTRDTRAAIASRIGRFVFDADPAVLVAGLLGVVAAEHGLAALAPGHTYLTSDTSPQDPALACFEVTDVLPFDAKRLRRLLKSRGVGRLEIKKRGVGHDLQRLRHRLHLRGEASAVLLLAPCPRTVTAILARRV